MMDNLTQSTGEVTAKDDSNRLEMILNDHQNLVVKGFDHEDDITFELDSEERDMAGCMYLNVDQTMLLHTFLSNQLGKIGKAPLKDRLVKALENIGVDYVENMNDHVSLEDLEDFEKDLEETCKDIPRGSMIKYTMTGTMTNASESKD